MEAVAGEGGTVAGPVVESEAGGAGGAITGPLAEIVGAPGASTDGSITAVCGLGVGSGVRSGAGDPDAGVTTTSGAAP
ncbi:MAG TPA: hypothetical protein VHX68_10615 [Planctomycetaceae bacterium]|nr:hypothetical protein [Planctomycetaceae bacterium]